MTKTQTKEAILYHQQEFLSLLAQLMVIEVVNLLDAEMERVTASYALIDCIIQA